MKSIDKIPISKIQRASKLISTGAKVGVNYIKYYGDKISKTEAEAKENLDKNNAEDIYNSLKDLKGSALKVAQMLSMEKNILPAAYVEKFSLSQFSVPPLSGPLVSKTFKTYFGKDPKQLYDVFESEARFAASIGQVHYAEKDGKKLAVKIQYPGVADSISSDLAMVKPIAMKILNLKGKDSERYFKEVEEKLLEETDYSLELTQSNEIVSACKNIKGITFPNYYPELSSDRIITMDWMEGEHISTFAKNNTDKAAAQKVGQALWDFYMFQIHELKKVHADPHPGNFLISKNLDIVALDFGCMKIIPEDFYTPYFELARIEVIADEAAFAEKMYTLEILREDDSPEEKAFFLKMFRELLTVFSRPFHQETFDFGDQTFFDEIAKLAETLAKSAELRKMNANRGSKHFIYMNRTFFGLYSLLNQLGANNIVINNFENWK